jgi:hypothetical protein
MFGVRSAMESGGGLSRSADGGPKTTPWYANITDDARPEPPSPSPRVPRLFGAVFLVAALAVTIGLLLVPMHSGWWCFEGGCAFLSPEDFWAAGAVLAIVFYALSAILLRDAARHLRRV